MISPFSSNKYSECSETLHIRRNSETACQMSNFDNIQTCLCIVCVFTELNVSKGTIPAFLNKNGDAQQLQCDSTRFK